jgi:hypothetical protein
MRLVWKIIRVPVVGGLLLLDPLVGVLCSMAFVLGLVACVIFLASPAGAHFPLLKMVAVFVGLGGAAILYQGLIALLVRP